MPRLLGEAVAAHVRSVRGGAPFATALDAGCGTGLAGPYLRTLVSGYLTGVDLSPKMVDAVFDNVRLLREQGKAILMVEQNVRKALSISDRGGVMELGSLRMQDQASRLIGDERVARLYLGRR